MVPTEGLDLLEDVDVREVVKQLADEQEVQAVFKWVVGQLMLQVVQDR